VRPPVFFDIFGVSLLPFVCSFLPPPFLFFILYICSFSLWRDGPYFSVCSIDLSVMVPFFPLCSAPFRSPFHSLYTFPYIHPVSLSLSLSLFLSLSPSLCAGCVHVVPLPLRAIHLLPRRHRRQQKEREVGNVERVSRISRAGCQTPLRASPLAARASMTRGIASRRPFCSAILSGGYLADAF